jgi:ligand-binding sensor domain-containing protein/serine phosphatase RsbU (regulator of sigma subunit)
MRGYPYYIALFIILIHSPLCAQTYLPPVNLTIENGLSSREVKSLTIDHYGYLWTGTDFGLNRFDGYRFLHFFITPGVNESPDFQFIHKVRCDNLGNLWILSNAGISRYDHYTGAISKFPISSFDTVYKPESVLIDIYPSPDGTAWLLTDRSLTGLSSDQQVKTYFIPPDQLLHGTLPTCLLADANGNIWIGTTNGLLLFDIRQGVFRELVRQGSQGLLSDNHVNCMFMDHENSLWIGTKNGLNHVDPIDFAFVQYYPVSSRISQPVNDITCISSAESGIFILATNAGIVKFDAAIQLFTSIFMSAGRKIESITVDSTGIIWGGTSQGILKIRKSVLSVQNFTTETADFKLANDHIVALEQGQGDMLFIGYYNNRYCFLDTKTFSSKHFNTIDGSNVVNFYPYKLNDYLVLSEHDIEVFITGKGDRRSLFSVYPFLKRELLKQVKINCLFYDGANQLWLGTSNGIQYIRFDSASHVSKQTLSYDGQQTRIGQVFDIKQDPFGNIWLGTDNGLLFYNPGKSNFIRYTPYDKNLMNTERKAVYTIVSEKTGVFLLGTSKGAFRFNVTNREFASICDAPEIMNSSVRALSIDRYNNIWIGAERGLFHFRRNTNTFKVYDLKEGLLNESYTAICSGGGEKMFLAGLQGLSMISLTEIGPVSKPQKVVITGLHFIDNDPIKQDLYYQCSDTIVLPWNKKPLQIDFAVLDFSRPELNHFKYCFGKAGRDHDWQQLGTLNHAVLDHLSPGNYIFRVTGSNSDMNWTTSGTSLVIIVEAPYWRSKIGVVLFTLAGIIIVFMFFRFWIRQFFNLSRENKEREMFARQIMLQKEELTLKNKSITDSINYAKRIQTAMLPAYKLFKSFFPSSFILFMPKDIVSGDFYWINKFGNKIFISAVDCTGHGVPGAFMSIIGFELFRKITSIDGLSRPSDILNRLNDGFHEIFKDIDNVVLRDGMDVAFCSIDKKDMILEFAGAFNPLYLIRDNKITEIKGDRFAIGLDETNFKDQTFKNHLIPIQKGDIIYIFSDGFADQFGGPDGKKYKYRRFRHLLLNLHQLPMEKQHEILENNVMEWRGEQDQVDDILVIGIKIDF